MEKKPFGSEYLEELSVVMDDELYGGDSGACPANAPSGATCVSSDVNGNVNHNMD